MPEAKKKRPRGRPKKRDEERVSDCVYISLKPRERKALRGLAEDLGRSESSIGREAILEFLWGRKRLPKRGGQKEEESPTV